MNANRSAHEAVDAAFRDESRRVLATLARILGDLDLAEDAMQEAFSAALRQWPRDGVPDNPRAWLISAGRFKAIDSIRRRARFNESLRDIAEQIDAGTNDFTLMEDNSIEDDRLRLIFICCHPTLPSEAQVALTLREVCGLTTNEIAHAFLTSTTTLAQRIVRAKSKIRTSKISFDLPEHSQLAERLSSVLHVAYLVFNEGYFASSGADLTRHDLSGEAIRLVRLVAELLPEPEVFALLSLMLLQESRRAARSTPSGDVILLDDQDRSLWNRDMISEGLALAKRAVSVSPVGVYALQAAIAAVHAEASCAAETDWRQIVAIYDILAAADKSPVVQLNRAVALAMRDGPEAGLTLIDALLDRGELPDYSLLHSARGELCRRLGRITDARSAYQQALHLAVQEPERRFLERRLGELTPEHEPTG